MGRHYVINTSEAVYMAKIEENCEIHKNGRLLSPPRNKLYNLLVSELLSLNGQSYASIEEACMMVQATIYRNGGHASDTVEVYGRQKPSWRIDSFIEWLTQHELVPVFIEEEEEETEEM